MKLVRFEGNGGARIGAVQSESVVDLVAAGSRWPTIRDIAAAGAAALAELSALVERATPSRRLSEVALLAPVERPGKSDAKRWVASSGRHARK